MAPLLLMTVKSSFLFLVSRLAIMSVSKLTEEQEQVQQMVGIIALAIP
jgi:hypothetical protein